jgi:hypothetical protein
MSESNIYEAPQADLGENKNITEEDREYFIAIARRQKHLIYTFFVYFIVSGFLGSASDELKPFLQLIGIPLFLVIIVFNIRLCWKLYGAVGRTVMIVLGLIPIVNFIVILVASSKTNKILKKAGFKVGFLGVKVSDIEQKAGETHAS